MRKQQLITGEYYHIYNRGVDKRDIFLDKYDINRFIEGLIEFNQTDGVGSLANLRKFKNKISQIEPKALSRKQLVEIIAYCLNPNHFHFILKQSVDGGIAKFMQKIQAGYTYYFNIKNSRSGSLFQGTFKSQIIKNEDYFNKLLGYVNKNYLIHNIPENKIDLVLASDNEYENDNFRIVSTVEGKKILQVFKNSKNFKKHCSEVVEAIREERGRRSLLEDEEIPQIEL